MGAPNFASGVAMRRSQHAVMLKPPPTAKPWICAITGLATRSSRADRAAPSRSYARPSSADSKTLNWLMSVPATNALPPAPRSTKTRTESSASTSSHASVRRWYMAQVIAFRASGRLKVRVSTGPSRVMSASVVSTSNLLGRRVVAWEDITSWLTRSLSEKPG